MILLRQLNLIPVARGKWGGGREGNSENLQPWRNIGGGVEKENDSINKMTLKILERRKRHYEHKMHHPKKQSKHQSVKIEDRNKFLEFSIWMSKKIFAATFWHEDYTLDVLAAVLFSCVVSLYTFENYWSRKGSWAVPKAYFNKIARVPEQLLLGLAEARIIYCWQTCESEL